MEKSETLNKEETVVETRKTASRKKGAELSALILDTPLNKYDMILLARRWAQELKSKEGESRSIHELIKVAIQDILSGDVSHKMVRELPVFRNLKKQRSGEIPFHFPSAQPQSSTK